MALRCSEASELHARHLPEAYRKPKRDPSASAPCRQCISRPEIVTTSLLLRHGGLTANTILVAQAYIQPKECNPKHLTQLVF